MRKKQYCLSKGSLKNNLNLASLKIGCLLVIFLLATVSAGWQVLSIASHEHAALPRRGVFPLTGAPPRGG